MLFRWRSRVSTLLRDASARVACRDVHGQDEAVNARTVSVLRDVRMTHLKITGDTARFAPCEGRISSRESTHRRNRPAARTAYFITLSVRIAIEAMSNRIVPKTLAPLRVSLERDASITIILEIACQSCSAHYVIASSVPARRNRQNLGL